MIVVSEVCSCLHISTRQSFAPSWWQEEPSFTKLVNVPFSPSLLLYYSCFPLRSFFLAEINWVCKKLAKKPLSIFYTTPVLILAWQTKFPLSPSHWNSTALLQGNGFTWITWMIFLLQEYRESKSSRLSSLHADIHIELGGASVLRLQRLARTLKLGNAWSTWKKLCSTCARMIEIQLVILFFDSFSTTLYEQSWWSTVLPITMPLLTDQHFSRSLYAISTTTGMWSDGKCSEGNAVLSRNRSSNGGSKIRVACRCRWSISV